MADTKKTSTRNIISGVSTFTIPSNCLNSMSPLAYFYTLRDNLGAEGCAYSTLHSKYLDTTRTADFFKSLSKTSSISSITRRSKSTIFRAFARSITTKTKGCSCDPLERRVCSGYALCYKPVNRNYYCHSDKCSGRSLWPNRLFYLMPSLK